MSALNAQVETFTRLITLGETVTEALDYTQVISTSGATEIERTVAAIGARELPAPVTGALDALTAVVERVIIANDPHRAIDWIGIYPRLYQPPCQQQMLPVKRHAILFTHLAGLFVKVKRPPSLR